MPRPQTSQEEVEKLERLGVELLASRAFDALRGPRSRGAVQTPLLPHPRHPRQPIRPPPHRGTTRRPGNREHNPRSHPGARPNTGRNP
jgi:hypothetical protein